MQSFGICFSKGINKLKGLKGQVYKSRYHLRKLTSPSEVKNVLHYILGNSVKHKTSSFINFWNSLVVSRNLRDLYPGFELKIEEVIEKSFALGSLKAELQQVLAPPEGYFLKKIS